MADKKEEFEVSGEDLVRTVKTLINEGNIRRISILSKDGQPIAEFPLTIGVVGVALAPMLAAVGVIAALVTECAIKVERR